MTTLNALYGYGYLPDLGTDSDFNPTTADVIARKNALYDGPGGALRSLRDQIPESPNAISILNMGRSGLNTMANWLQGSPEIGPDTVAPLGLSAAGMAMVPRNALGSAGGRLSLSDNQWHRPRFRYDILRDGEQIGVAQGLVDGTKAHIEWLGKTGGHGGANELGVSGVRELRELFRREFPDASEFSGRRVSGAKKDLHDATQSVRILSDQSKGSVPGTVLNALAESQKPQGIRAYHGSPHDFDRFDMSKIGTGEGAQAYGHGLYFAEAEGVARSYRDQLSDYSEAVTWKGEQPATPLQESLMRRLKGTDASGAPMTVNKLKVEIARTIRQEMAAAEGAFGIRIPEAAERAKQLRQEWEELDRIADHIQLNPPSGRMYEVNIKANPEDFLDLDAPLSKQSDKVKAALRSEPVTAALRDAYSVEELPDGRFIVKSPGGSMGARSRAEAEQWLNEMRDAASVDRSLADYNGAYILATNTGQRGAISKALIEAGVAGTRYLDQGSRAGGEGTRNFVVFDDAIVDILRKYGLAGAIGAGALAGGGGDAMANLTPPETPQNERERTSTYLGGSQPVEITPEERMDLRRRLQEQLRNPDAPMEEDPVTRRQIEQDYRTINQMQRMRRELEFWPRDPGY